jgi:Zn-dependent peptidase ImmA (M78 family)
MNKSRRLAIEKIADNVRSECKVTDYGFKNIFEAAEKIGYRVIRYPIGNEAFLGLAMIKDGERIIFSNSSIILSREVFSVAHEMGHQRLHLSEAGLNIIKDDDFSDRDEHEVEANYFAACLLMPREMVEKYIRHELRDKSINNLSGLDIARIQTSFNVSYDMALIRLKALGILDGATMDWLKFEKLENSTTNLLNAINGNVGLCKPTEAKTLPAEYLEWVISNYNEKLIPLKSLESAFNYVGLKVEDVDILITDEEEEDVSFNDLLREMD